MGPEISTYEAIGITFAICGNVLISFSLKYVLPGLGPCQLLTDSPVCSLQKLAHRRLELGHENTGTSPDLQEDDAGHATETQPLLPRTHVNGIPKSAQNGASRGRSLVTRLTSFKLVLRRKKNAMADLPVDVTTARVSPMSSPTLESVSSPGTPMDASRSRPTPRRQGSSSSASSRQEGQYLKSKLWCVLLDGEKKTVVVILALVRWIGFLLMNIGEIGNFISYGFAPASVVAPLGTVSIFGLFQLFLCSSSLCSLRS
jgi:hypothetical protein